MLMKNAPVVVMMKKTSSTRLTSISGIMSTSSSSSSCGRFHRKPPSTGSSASAWSSARNGSALRREGPERRKPPAAQHFARARGVRPVVFEEAPLLHPVSDDGIGNLLVNLVRLDDPHVEEAAFLCHDGNEPHAPGWQPVGVL